MWSKKWSNLNLVCFRAMCGEFGELAAIIGLVFDFLAFGLHHNKMMNGTSHKKFSALEQQVQGIEGF